MYRRILNPWQGMDDLQQEMNRLFSAYVPSRRSAHEYPAVNILANDEEAVVTAEIPGVKAEDIDISVNGETVTLKGTRQADEIPEEACCYRKEHGYGSFSRSIELPYRVDAEKVEAVFDKGILSVKLPRSEEDKPKKIAVKLA